MPNAAATRTAITPRRAEDFPEWYQQVIRAAELAEPSDVRGCMVIRPWGYGIWENMQRQLDAMFRATGRQGMRRCYAQPVGSRCRWKNETIEPARRTVGGSANQ